MTKPRLLNEQHTIRSMNKVVAIYLLVCFLIISTFYSMGSGTTKFDDGSNLSIDELTTKVDTVLPVPQDGTTPLDHKINDNYYIALGNLIEKGSFVTEGTGSSTALFVDQKIKAARVVNGNETYKMSSSMSDFVSVAKETYVSGKTYLTRNASKMKSIDDITWGNEASKISEESFLSLYGYVPNGISGYIVTDDTILSSKYLGEENGIYGFEYTLDTQKATTRLKYEMRTMAGTKSFPNFNSVILTVYMDKQWNIVKTTTNCSYEVDMLGGVTCSEKLTETFNAIGENTPVPNEEYFRSFVDAEITEGEVGFNPDAMYYLTNGFTEYMSGKPLSARLSIKGDGLSVNGSLLVNLDINNLENIKVKAMLNLALGDVKLDNVFIAFENDTLYFAYQGLKAKCKISEATTVIGELLPMLGVTLPDLSSLNINADELLSGATLVRQNGNATVNLPLSLGGITADIDLNFFDNEQITFTGISGTALGLEISVLPAPEIEYHYDLNTFVNALSLLDIIDEDGNIRFDLALGEITAKANFNIPALALDLSLGELSAKYLGDTIYIKYKALEGFVKTSEIQGVIEKFAPLLGSDLDLTAILTSILGNFNPDTVIADIVNGISAEELDGALTISSVLGKARIKIVLAITESGYALDEISASLGDLALSATPSVNEMAIIENTDDYCDLLPLLDIIDEDYNINAKAVIGDITADICFNIKDMTLLAKANLFGKDLYAKLENDTIFVSYLGLKAKASIDEISEVVKFLSPLFGEEIDLSSLLGSLSLDIEELISSIAIDKTSDGVTITVPFEGVNINANLSTNNKEYKLANITVTVDTLNIVVTPSTKANYSAIADTSDYNKLITLLDIIDEDYNINAQAVIGDITADICFNLKDMTLLAKANLFGKDLYAKFENDTIFVSYLGLEAKASIDEISEVVKFLSPLFGEEIDLSSLLGSLSLDIEELISSITTTEYSQGVILSVPFEGVNINANLSTNNKEYKLANITVTVDTLNIAVTPSTKADYSAISNTSDYNKLVTLLDIIDEDYNINAQAVMGDITADICFNLKDMTLLAKANLFGKDLYAKLENDTIFVSYLGLKAKASIDEISEVVKFLSPLFGEEIDLGSLLGSLSLDIEEIISSITTTEYSQGVILSVPFEGVNINATLSTNNKEYKLANITVSVDNLNIAVTPSTKANYNAIADTSDYNKLVTLLDIIDENYNVNAKAVIGDITADICFNLKDMTLLAKANLFGKDLYAKLENNTIFVSYLGLEAKASIDVISEVVKFLSPLFGEEIDLSSLLGSLSLDIEEIISSITTTEYSQGVILSVPFEGVNINANLSTNNKEYALANITVSVDNLNIAVTPSTKADYSAIADTSDYNKLVTLLDIIDEDYNINAQAVIGDITADICFNLKDMTLLAKANLFGKDLYAKFENDTIFVSYLGLKAKATLDEISEVVKFLSPLFGEEIDLGSLLGSLSLDIEEIISSITTTEYSQGVILSVPFEGVNINATLSTNNKEYKLANITVTVDTLNIAVTPSTKADYSAIADTSDYNKLATLLDIIDSGYNIPLKINVGATTIDANFNINDLAINIKIGEIEAYIDLNEKTAYAMINDIKLMLCLDDITTILDKVMPSLEKLLPVETVEMLSALDLGSLLDINIDEIISSIESSKTQDGLSLTLEIEGINLEVVLSTENNEYALTEIIVSLDGTEINVTPSEKATFTTFDLSANYINLKEIVDKYADALNNIIVTDNLVMTLSGTVNLGSSQKLTITEGKASVLNMTGEPSVKVTLTLLDQKFDEAGEVAKERTHTVTLVYRDGLVYLNYNGFEGKFTLDKLKESKASVQTILGQIPELKDLLSTYIELGEDNWLAPISIDILSLLGGASFDDGVLSLGLNLSTLMGTLQDEMTLALSTSDNKLVLNIPDFALADIALALTVTAEGVTDETLDGAFDYTASKNCNDFSSIDTLLATLAQTTKYRNFELSGEVSLFLGDSWGAVDNKVHLSAKLDIIDGKTYAVVSIARDKAKVIGINVWNDEYGTATLYFDPIDEMIYIKDIHYVKEGGFLGIGAKTVKKEIYKKYTIEGFTADIMTPLLDMIHLNSIFENLIVNAEPSDTSEAYIENIFKSYAYNDSENKFSIAVDLSPLTGGDIRTTTLELTHNDNYDLTNLFVNMNVVGIINVKLNAQHVQQFGHYNGADTAVKQETLNSKYTLVK